MSGLILILFVGAAADQDTAFDAFFAEFASKREGIRTLEAEFAQESVIPEETIESEGSVVYVKPRRIVFKYAEPDPTYLIDGSRAYEYAPDLKQLQVYDLEDNPQTEVFFLGFDDDTRRLREAYQVEVFEPAGEPEGARGIRLRPETAEGEEACFEQVTLFLRAEDYLPYRIHIVNDPESQVTIRVTGFVVNGALDPERTQIHLPEGTTIIEHDELVETVGPGGLGVPKPTPVSDAKGADAP